MRRVTIGLILLTMAALPASAQSPDPKCRTAGPQCTRAFGDVPSGHWAGEFIRVATSRGWIPDCGGTAFCPDDPVPRADMAVFIANAMRDGQSTPLAAPTGVFRDVTPSSMQACWIEQLYADGIVSGCRQEDGHTFYCPNDLVNRAQMAVFISAALGLSPVNPPTGYFTDVHGTGWAWAEGFIEAIHNADITAGCGDHLFCPADNITRAQLAVWLTVAFGHSKGVDTVGFYRSSDRTWFLRNSNTAGPLGAGFVFGVGSGDVPIVGDWNGDSIDTIGVFRIETVDTVQRARFYLRDSNNAGGADNTFMLTDLVAQAGDIPVTGDWNGDRIDTIGVYRPGTRTWYLRNSNTPGTVDITLVFGTSGATPRTGDWNGDGIDTVGYYKDRYFYLRNSNTTGSANTTVLFGNTGDTPIVHDWDGNLTDTIGVYRPTTKTWYLRNSNAAGSANVTFIYPTDSATGLTPIVGDWNGN